MAEDVAQHILSMERSALDRWGKGDPGGFLEITDEDVVYFDPFQPRRLENLAELRGVYEGLRGKIRIARDEIVDPKVQRYGDIAVLTFRFNSWGSEQAMRWNVTEVYQHCTDGWRIVHSHWSFTQPALAA